MRGTQRAGKKGGTERSGYVVQGADALPRAGEHAHQAKDLATCDGPSDCAYKAVYDEAIALLEDWA